MSFEISFGKCGLFSLHPRIHEHCSFLVSCIDRMGSENQKNEVD